MSGKQSTTSKNVTKKVAATKNQNLNKNTELSVVKQKEEALSDVLKHASFLNNAKKHLNWYTKKMGVVSEMMKENELKLEMFTDDFSIEENTDNNSLSIKLERKTTGYREDTVVSIDDPRILQLFMQFLFEYFEKKKETVINRILEEEQKYKS